MSQQQVKAFINNLNQEEKLQETLQTNLESSLNISENQAIDSEEEVNRLVNLIVNFAGDQGFTFTADEYKDFINNRRNKKELSDKELEGVAGGIEINEEGMPYLAIRRLTS